MITMLCRHDMCKLINLKMVQNKAEPHMDLIWPNPMTAAGVTSVVSSKGEQEEKTVAMMVMVSDLQFRVLSSRERTQN